MTELLRQEKGREFLEALEDLDFERHKFAPEDLESKFKTVFAYCKAEKTKLHELLPQVAAAAAREYVGAVHALDLVVKANAMAAWAEQVPDEEHLQPYLDAFRGSKVSAQKAAEFLVGAYKARKKFEASWKRSSGAVWGDDSDDAPEKPKHHKRKPETSDDSSEQKKKKSKKERKDKKRKAASSSGSSCSKDVKTKKKEKGGKDKTKKKNKKEKTSSESSSAKKKGKKDKDAKDKGKKKPKENERESKKKQRSRSSSKAASIKQVRPRHTKSNNKGGEDSVHQCCGRRRQWHCERHGPRGHSRSGQPGGKLVEHQGTLSRGAGQREGRAELAGESFDRRRAADRL